MCCLDTGLKISVQVDLIDTLGFKIGFEYMINSNVAVLLVDYSY